MGVIDQQNHHSTVWKFHHRIRFTGVVALAAFYIVVLSLLVWYGFRVFPDLPWIDDWTVINRLMEYLHGHISLLAYIFTRHNVHFIVPARLAFLFSYAGLRLNLAAIRWCSLLVICATAVYYTRVMSLDVSNQYRNRILPLGYLFILALIIMPIVTLGQWEVFSVAMEISNVTSNLAAIVGVVYFDRYLRNRRETSYWSAILLGLVSWQSMANGALLFLVYMITLLMYKDMHGKWLKLLIVCLCAVGIPLIEAHAAHASNDLIAVFTGQYSLKRCLLGALSILGVGIIWGMHNKPYLPGVILAGGIVCLGTVYVLWHYVFIPINDENARLVLRKYWMLTMYGVLSDIAVYFGRIHFGVAYLASSRYIPISMLTIIGITAYFYLLSCKTLRTTTTRNTFRLRTAYSAILFASIVFGYGVTNVSEIQMARYRRASYVEAARYLRSDHLSTRGDKQRLYLQSNQLAVLPSVLDWMKSNHLCLFDRHDHS